jgi:crossover junction endodeoxyribonuclease RusA
VKIYAFPPDARRRDLDNLLKSLLDALQHAGIMEDDGQVDMLSIERRARKKGGSISVYLREVR